LIAFHDQVGQTDAVATLAEALAAAQGQFEALAFDAKNDHFGSRYATLSALLAVVRPALARNGIALLQHPVAEGSRLGIVTELRKGDEVIRSVISWELPPETTPHKLFAAVTYFKRHALQAILGIAGEDDDDGNAASTPPRKPFRPPPSPTPPAEIASQGRFKKAAKTKNGKGVEAFFVDTSTGEELQVGTNSEAWMRIVSQASGSDAEFAIVTVPSTKAGVRKLESIRAVDAAGDAIAGEVF
jgi:hypothetical protein